MWESCRAWLQLHEKAEIEDIKGSISWFQGVKICKKYFQNGFPNLASVQGSG
jgi:hypothetical protein